MGKTVKLIFLSFVFYVLINFQMSMLFKNIATQNINNLSDLELSAYIKYVDLPNKNLPDVFYTKQAFWKYYRHVTFDLILEKKTHVNFKIILQRQNININEMIEFFLKNIDNFSTTQQNDFFNFCFFGKRLNTLSKLRLLPFITTKYQCVQAVTYQNFDITELPTVLLNKLPRSEVTDFYLETGYIKNNLLTKLKTIMIETLFKRDSPLPLAAEADYFEKLTTLTTLNKINWDNVVFFPLESQFIFNATTNTQKIKKYFQNQPIDVMAMFFRPTIIFENIELFEEFIDTEHIYTTLPKELFSVNYFKYWFFKKNFFVTSTFSETILRDFFTKVGDFLFMNETNIGDFFNDKRNQNDNIYFKNMLTIHAKNIAAHQNISEEFAIEFRTFDLISHGSARLKFTSAILPFKKLISVKDFLQYNRNITQELFIQVYIPKLFDFAKENNIIKPSWYRAYYESRLVTPQPKIWVIPTITNETDDKLIARNINNHIVDPTTLNGFLKRNPTWFLKICAYENCSLEILEILLEFAYNNKTIDTESNGQITTLRWLLHYQSLPEAMLENLLKLLPLYWNFIVKHQILSQSLINMLVLQEGFRDPSIFEYQIVASLEVLKKINWYVRGYIKPLTLSEDHVNYLIDNNIISIASAVRFKQSVNLDSINDTLQMIYNPLFETPISLIKEWFNWLFPWVNFQKTPDVLLETLNDVERIADTITRFLPITTKFVIKYRLFTINTIYFTQFDESFWAEHFYLFTNASEIFFYQKFSIPFLQKILVPVAKNLISIVNGRQYSHQELAAIKACMPEYKWPHGGSRPLGLGP